MKKIACGIILMMGIVAAACNAPAAGGMLIATETGRVVTGSIATMPLPPTVIPAAGGEEAIMILEPGPGSRLVSPMHVTGWSDPTFEQGLSVRLLSFEGGEIIATMSTQIMADVGQRGAFAVEIPFTVTEEQNALLQVLSYSPRDGGVTHLSSVIVTLLPDGIASLIARSPYPEQIEVLQPAPGSIVAGGIVHVEGVAIASFEGTLVVELYDETGSLLASEPLIVDAPDMGLPGTFALDLVYSISSEGAGRVVVIDPSPAFDGFNHLASVEVRLQP
jgi:hypothetical protein